MQPETIAFTTFAESTPSVLDALGVADAAQGWERVLLKPNLVNASPHPITTHVDFTRAVATYLKDAGVPEIVVAEGCGEASKETDEVFAALGYVDMAAGLGIELLDLNQAPLVTVDNPANTVFPEMHLPEIAFSHVVVSLPVLKAHSLAGFTGSLKNMMGFCPPRHYGNPGSYKKAKFHTRMQGSIIDLNRFITPTLTVMDASIGLKDYHLGGPECDPHIATLAAGFDAFAVDAWGAAQLGMDPAAIRHISVGL
jgi:uncharacterized protein (DUF362 family)